MIKLLVIEDERPTLEAWKMFFEMVEGYTVFGTTMGNEALEIIEKEHPNVILCDLQLKDSPITGIEVLKQTYEKHPDIKVIIVTGYAKDPDIKKICMQYNPAGFLGKPVVIEEIHDVIKNAVKDTQKEA